MPAAPLPPPAAGLLCACRTALARRAAALAAAGQTPDALLPALCRLTTAELLQMPGPAPAAVDLEAELCALCAAAAQAVRRRPGWLRVCPAGRALPVGVPRRLLQAAVLGVLAGALRRGRPAQVGWRAGAGGALLWVRGAPPAPEQAGLLPRLAAVGGGAAAVAARPPFAAAVRLPLAAVPAQKAAGQAEDLLADRYSLLYQYLSGFCAGPDL